MPSALRRCGGFFDYDNKSERLTEVSRELEDPGIWSTPEKAQELGRERSRLEGIVSTLDKVSNGLTDARELLDMAVEENDEGTVAGVQTDIAAIEQPIAKLEFQRMFPGQLDPHSARPRFRKDHDCRMEIGTLVLPLALRMSLAPQQSPALL